MCHIGKVSNIKQLAQLYRFDSISDNINTSPHVPQHFITDIGVDEDRENELDEYLQDAMTRTKYTKMGKSRNEFIEGWLRNASRRSYVENDHACVVTIKK